MTDVPVISAVVGFLLSLAALALVAAACRAPVERAPDAVPSGPRHRRNPYAATMGG